MKIEARNYRKDMTIYKTWTDFVSFPLDSNKCRSKEQRLNLTDAVFVHSPDYSPQSGTEKGVVVTDDFVLFDKEDRFVAMEINDFGGVVIWTRKRVWCLQSQGNLEKLIYLPRHPAFHDA